MKTKSVKQLSKFVTVNILQADYGDGWTDETGSIDRKEIRADLKDYRENVPNTPFRIIRRRILRTVFDSGKW